MNSFSRRKTTRKPSHAMDGVGGTKRRKLPAPWLAWASSPKDEDVTVEDGEVMDYPGFEGFLGSRASFMLDVVFLAMFFVVPVMGWSIYQVKYRHRFLLHKQIQIGIGVVLLSAVTLFEIDMRANGWRERAEASPYYNAGWSAGWVNWSLWIHLPFAVSTSVLWVFVMVQALRKFPRPPQPNEYAPRHKFWARIAAVDLCLTGLTGWIFYWLAFVATAS